MFRVLVIGAVQTTSVTLDKLIEHQFNVVGVMGHEPINIGSVSGWTNLKVQSEEMNLAYYGFQKINDIIALDWASDKKPDIIFAVGFSQLMNDEWLKLPKLGCIGFHPTNLPNGRGRAPLSWITLEMSKGSATFFLMGKGADDGPIFVQSVFEVLEMDDAATIEGKIKTHIELALDEWLPNLKVGNWHPIPQDDSRASYYGKRSLADGIIDWSNSAYNNNRLIKATTKPHPGAYTYFKDQKLIIWESEIETKLKIKGVIGRILLIREDKFLIQCGEGLLWIHRLEFDQEELPINIGDKLGYDVQDEIYRLKRKLKNG